MIVFIIIYIKKKFESFLLTAVLSNRSRSLYNLIGFNMRELLDIAEVLRVIRSLTEWRSKNAGVETVLDNYFGSMMPNKFLEQRITTAIISEEEMSDNASPALYDIRRKIRAASSNSVLCKKDFRWLSH